MTIRPLGPIVLAILDGWGIAPPSPGNAITRADTPELANLVSRFPSSQLIATGQAVGLAENQASGSEAGHMNIGGGRIVPQETMAITVSIYEGTFFKNPALLRACEYARSHRGALHLMGLLSTSDSPHSDPRHLNALLELARKERVDRTFLHLFTDGRDSSPKAGYRFLRELSERIKKKNLASIATVAGRYWAMDRVGHVDRTLQVYDAIVNGKGEKSMDAVSALVDQYEKGISDEYIHPTVITRATGEAVGTVQTGDAVIFFNFRAERARQLAKMFVADDGPSVGRSGNKIQGIEFVTLADYGPDVPSSPAFESPKLTGTLVHAAHGLRQLYIAEAEKFAHVTYFFAGRNYDTVGNEERLLLPSAEVMNYVEKPEMESEKVTSILTDRIQRSQNELIVVNYPNADMLGHTGNIYAAMTGVEVVSKCLEKLANAVLQEKGVLIITADHGNAEEMIDYRSGEAVTAHSRNAVPFLLVMDNAPEIENEGLLGNVAPTIVELAGLTKPNEMIEDSLIRKAIS